jgi:hypothetical protein
MVRVAARRASAEDETSEAACEASGTTTAAAISPTNRRLPLARLRTATAARLRARRPEVDDAIIHRVLCVAPATGKEAPGYVEALREAIPSAVEYALEAIQLGEERIGPMPAPIIVQTAASARSKVGLEVVLRRYAAGYTTLSDFLHQEIRALAGDSHPGYVTLQRELSALFDRLVGEVSETYRREEARASRSSRERRLDRIHRLLVGELVDESGLDYPLTNSHLAVIARGRDAEGAVVTLAKRLDRSLLIAEGSENHCVAWLGGTRPPEPEALDRGIRGVVREDLQLSLGEPGHGIAGWRRSRRQAGAADLVGKRSGAEVVHYRDVALIAAALRDPDLAAFLTETYLAPLQADRLALVKTLLAFLERNRNVSSTAAALGIARQTVANHLRTAEQRLGRASLDSGAQLETALRLAELDH